MIFYWKFSVSLRERKIGYVHRSTKLITKAEVSWKFKKNNNNLTSILDIYLVFFFFLFKKRCS